MKETGSSDEAKFLNEVMDADKRYALLAGEIGLLDQWLNGDYLQTTYVNRERNLSKPASPSRMMRIWEDVESFDEKIFKTEKQNNKVTRLKFNASKQNNDAPENVIYSADLNNKENKNILSKLISHYFVEDNIVDCNKYIPQIISAITYNHTLKLELLFKRDTLETITDYPEIEIDGTGFKIKLYEIIKKYILIPGQLKNLETEDRIKSSFANVTVFNSIDSNEFVDGEMTVSKIKSIYSYSGEFMYLIPAGKAMEISNRLRNEFNEKYAKTLGRLCLNIGAVFSNHKYPLYMVLDAGKRMLKEFKVAYGAYEDKRKYKINGDNDVNAYGVKAKVSKKKDDGSLTIEFLEHIFKQETEEILVSPEKTCLHINNKIIVDKYYPYFLKVDDEDKVTPVHLNEISQGDQILYAPGVFDFEWLDSSKARVNIILKKESDWRKRDSLFPMVKTRPYRVNFMELMNKFISELTEGLNNKQITKTALEHYRESLYSNIYNLCIHKNSGFPDASDKKLIKDISMSMIANMAGLEHISAKEDLINFSKSLEIFDLLELKLFLNQN